MAKLAILGGKKVRTKPFPFYRVIDQKEIKAVVKVLRSGILSKYLGAWHEDFYGGFNVRALEQEWAKYFKVKHAISVNSATSGLICAMGASGIGPGDEVIVSPYSMSISATAPLFYGAIPVFADVEKDYFCLDPKSIEKKITQKTKAIIAVDLFGQPYDAFGINRLAAKHGLTVIEDASQAPGAKLGNKYAGTLGEVGVFSLNYHKHIHCGEGGLAVTNNDKLAERIRLIRNHADAVVDKKPIADLTNLLGYNFRMTEVEAAIAREQLKKLDSLINKRIANVKYLTAKLKLIPFIKAVGVRPKAKHVYYVQPFIFNEQKAGVSRDKYIEAVKAELAVTKNREKEGVKIASGYVKPLYFLPLFQKRICFGNQGWPFNLYQGNVQKLYQKGVCPVVENLYEETLFFHDLMHPNMAQKDLDDVVKAFYKVAGNIQQLK